MAYDGEGQRVALQVNGGTPTYYLGNLEEIAGSTLTKYLGAAGLPTAVRMGTGGTLNYLASDGAGSAIEALDGNVTFQQLSLPYGGTHYTSGTAPTTRAAVARVSSTGTPACRPGPERPSDTRAQAASQLGPISPVCLPPLHQ